MRLFEGRREGLAFEIAIEEGAAVFDHFGVVDIAKSLQARWPAPANSTKYLGVGD